MDASLCEQIASFRRKVVREGIHRFLFVDETALRLSEADTHTIVLPGEQPFVIASETSSYAKRYDMIACCTSTKTLLPMIYSPAERSDAGVKGINGAMLLQFSDNFLAQAVEAIDFYPLTLVLDRAAIHLNTNAILQAFRDRSCNVIKDIILLPPTSAKRLSPLDNSLFHDWKQICRQHCPLTDRTIKQVMNDAWSHLDPAPHYRNCGLTSTKDVYFDCPAPAIHKHGS